MDNNLYLEVAKLIGEPINTKLPVPVELSVIADSFTADAGEHVYQYTKVDNEADYILDVDADGKITVIKKSPLVDTPLTFKHLNSRLEYVLVKDVLESPDTKVLARKKAGITRGMDKREIKIILDAIETASAPTYPDNEDIPDRDAVSGEDLYDVVIGMKQKVEDYGDNFVLLVGTDVKAKMDTYDKDHVEDFRYRIGLMDELKKADIEVVKMFGKVDSGSGEVAIFDAKHMILVARNSRIAEGKPIKFVRRKISADIAKLMGADVDNAQRAVIVNPVPVQVNFGSPAVASNVLGYGVYGYESVVMAITNPLALCKSDATLALV